MALRKDVLPQICKVVFVDDSPGNIATFKKEVEEYGLYPGAEIHYVALDRPSNDPREDFLRASGPGCPVAVEVNDVTTVAGSHVLDAASAASQVAEAIHGGEMIQVSDKEEAKSLYMSADVAIGDVIFWPSASKPGEYSILKKQNDGPPSPNSAKRVGSLASVLKSASLLNRDSDLIDVSSREEAVKRYEQAQEGDVIFWPSKSEPGKYGYFKKVGEGSPGIPKITARLSNILKAAQTPLPQITADPLYESFHEVRARFSPDGVPLPQVPMRR